MNRMGLLVARVLLTAMMFNGVSTALAGPRPSSHMRDKMALVVTRIEVEEAPLRAVLELIRDGARNLAVQDGAFNMLVRCSDVTLDRKISISLEDVPIGEVIRYVCMAAGIHHVVEKHAVIIYDDTAKGIVKMETRAFRIHPSNPIVQEATRHEKREQDAFAED